MLTADHVDARRQGDKLVLKKLDARDREDALALAEAYLEAARAHVGRTRAEVSDVWGEIDAGAPKRRLALGLRKLVEDGCVFDEDSPLDPVSMRRDLFQRATVARRSRDVLAPFDREAVVAEVAASLAQAPAEIERGLFSDLRGEHLLQQAPVLHAASLVASYELGRAQAILLRAVRVRCEVHAGAPAAIRALFAAMKFHRLLFTVERLLDGGFAMEIDGPFSMFESVTKYGLRLALVLPALRTLETWSLTADVRWGKERTPLSFALGSEDRGEPVAPPTTDDTLNEDVRALLDGINGLAKGAWRAEIAQTLLDRPGLGVCIPDLVLTKKKGKKEPVYVELLGFWSRDAVWRRVELAQQGLGARIVFCASSRLRVSPEVMGDEAPAALYVYKGKPSARALLEHVDRLAAAPSV